jgi:hypothetical protein
MYSCIDVSEEDAASVMAEQVPLLTFFKNIYCKESMYIMFEYK